jgi:hypothetical protein
MMNDPMTNFGNLHSYASIAGWVRQRFGVRQCLGAFGR